MRVLIVVVGVCTSVLLLVLYWALLWMGIAAELVRTFIFATFSIYSLMLAFSLRSLDKSIFSYNPFANRALTAGVGIGIGLTLLALHIPPLRDAFGMALLPPIWLIGVFGVGLFNISLAEIGKWVVRKTIDNAHRA